jgi:hypothetical protein
MTDQPKPEKFCPLLSAGPQGELEPCHRENCAWWDPYCQCCGILSMGRGISASRASAGDPISPPSATEKKTPKPPPQPVHPEHPRMCQDCKHYKGPRWEGDYAYCFRHRHPLPPKPLVGCEAWEPKEG